MGNLIGSSKSETELLSKYVKIILGEVRQIEICPNLQMAISIPILYAE